MSVCCLGEGCWFKKHQDAFEDLKHRISSPPTLKYYDVQKPVTLTCDASQIGLVCLQEDAPVAYASCTLTQTKVRCMHIEKQLLAVVYSLAPNSMTTYMVNKFTLNRTTSHW